MKRILVAILLIVVISWTMPICIAQDKTIDQANIYTTLYNRILTVSPLLGPAWADWLAHTIIYYSQQYNVDPLLVAALFEMESRYSMYQKTDRGWQLLTSRTGAIGIAQLQPETAAGLGVSPEDPEQNVKGGILYLAQQLWRFRNAGQWTATYAVAAYNAGPGAIEAYGGVPPYQETINHVIQVGRIYQALTAQI